MPIEIDSIEEVFAAATDLTVGLEEEFAILDPRTLDMVARFEELSAAASELDPVLFEAITGELIASEIEIISGRGEDLHGALASQRDARRRLFGLASDRGAALGSTGTHPWADYREQRNIDTEHYRRVVEGLGYVARRNNTFSLHAHVGARDIDRAVRACDRLRPVLPLLLAVSASSPFLEGQDTRLHSARTQTFTRSFPRCGVPDAFGGWPAFRDYLDFLIRTNSVAEYTQVWWSIRPHASFGTVEVRVCDAQVTAAESEELAGMIVACVGQALRDIDEGVAFEHPAPRLIEENMWRATRYGLDGRMIDLRLGVEIEARTALDELLAWTAPVRDELRIDPAFDRPSGAQRQRAALLDGADLREVYAATVRETMTTYAQGGSGMSDSEAQRPEQAAPDGSVLSEGELRAAYEAQLARIRVDDVLVETVVSVLNLAARRAGLTGAGDEEIDHDQVSLAIDATRALLPLVEGMLGPEAKQVRDALSQLQLAYARSGAAPPAASGEKDPDEGEPDPQQGDSKGPAQTSGRLWVPGQ